MNPQRVHIAIDIQHLRRSSVKYPRREKVKNRALSSDQMGNMKKIRAGHGLSRGYQVVSRLFWITIRPRAPDWKEEPERFVNRPVCPGVFETPYGAKSKTLAKVRRNLRKVDNGCITRPKCLTPGIPPGAVRNYRILICGPRHSALSASGQPLKRVQANRVRPVKKATALKAVSRLGNLLHGAKAAGRCWTRSRPWCRSAQTVRPVHGYPSHRPGFAASSYSHRHLCIPPPVQLLHNLRGNRGQ